MAIEQINNSIQEKLASTENKYLNLKIYPNPFTESTTIKYLIPENSFVSIKVYDRHGGFVSTLVAKTQNKGEYEINWNGKNHQGKPVKEGIYYISLWSNGNVKTIKLYKN